MNKPAKKNPLASASLAVMLLLGAFLWGLASTHVQAVAEWNGRYHWDVEELNEGGSNVHCFCQSTNANCGGLLGCENWPE